MKRVLNRMLKMESLSLRAMMAADVVVAEDFNDGNANEFTSFYSNTQSAGVVDSKSSHGNVMEIVYSRDESQALLSESINARSVDVSYETRFLDSIPVSQVKSGFLGIKLSRLIVSAGDKSVASMQNELHVYGAGTDGRKEDQFAFQTFIDPANKNDNPVIDSPTEWQSVRYYGLLNTPGKNDGVWIVWLNGKKVVEHRDVRWTDAPDAKFTTFWVGGNISLQGQDPATPIRRQIDNVRVVVDSPESPTPPAPQPLDAVRVETVDGDRVMLVDGTNQNDGLSIVIQKGQASVRLNGKLTSFTGIDRVEVATLDGNDSLSIVSDIPVTVHGGLGNDRMHLLGTGLYHATGDEGDDTMTASGSQAILHGGDGKDSLYAVGGKKLLIGGLGEDLLVSLSNRDPHVLIADDTGASSEVVDLVFESLAELRSMDDAIVQMLNVTFDGDRDRVYDLGRTRAFSIGETSDVIYRRRR